MIKRVSVPGEGKNGSSTNKAAAAIAASMILGGGKKRNQNEMSQQPHLVAGSSSNLSALSGLSSFFHHQQQQQQFPVHIMGGSGSTGSLGSLGSLGMGGAEANIAPSRSSTSTTQNEPFNLTAPPPPSGGASAFSTSGLSGLSGLSALLNNNNNNNSANSLGLNSLSSGTNNNHSAVPPPEGKQNATFQEVFQDDISAFGKSFYSTRNNNNGSALSLLSNLSAGSAARSVGSTNGSIMGLRMNGSELNFFKDLFKPNDLEGDVPMLCPSTGQLPINTTQGEGGKQNAIFDTTQMMVNSNVQQQQQQSGLPNYVSSNGFLQKKPSLLEPSTEELLGLIDATGSSTEGGLMTERTHHMSHRTITSSTTTKNEDLNRSESVFPTKLHRMLQDAKREGFEHIVSWIHGGTAFKVHDVTEFMTKIMPIYFDQSKFESFRRQLNLYGFTRVTRGASRGMYYHQDFVQNDVSLCQNINRPKTVRNKRGRSSKQSTAPEDEEVVVMQLTPQVATAVVV